MGGRLMPDRGRRGSAGFTFVETMVAMALLAFIVGDLAMVMVYAGRSRARAQRAEAAAALAQAAAERARNTDFNKLDLPANPAFECYTPAGLAVACGGPAACFTLRRGVTPLGGGLLADALAADLDVLVTWEGGQRFQLSDVLSRY